MFIYQVFPSWRFHFGKICQKVMSKYTNVSKVKTDIESVVHQCELAQPEIHEKSENSGAPKIYKITVLGETAVGKTSLLERFSDNVFEESRLATIGINFLSKTILMDDGQRLCLRLWDTAGIQRFQNVSVSHIRECNSAIIVQ